MFACVKCSFALYPVVDERVTCDEPLITPSPFISKKFPSICVEPEITPLGKIAVTLPLVTVPNVTKLESPGY